MGQGRPLTGFLQKPWPGREEVSGACRHPPSLHPCKPYQGRLFQAPHNPPAPLAVCPGSSTLILPMEVAFVIESFPGGETEAHRGARGMWAQVGATFSGRPGNCMLGPLVSVQGRGQRVSRWWAPPAPNQPPPPSPSPFGSASRCPPCLPCAACVPGLSFPTAAVSWVSRRDQSLEG